MSYSLPPAASKFVWDNIETMMSALGLNERRQLPDIYVCGESDPLGARVIVQNSLSTTHTQSMFIIGIIRLQMFRIRVNFIYELVTDSL